MAETDLPEALQKLPAAERENHVNELAKKRTTLQNQILQLNNERERFLREANAKAPGGPGGLDDALHGAIREQAKARGINLEK